jgi:hypothetical protein
MGTLKDTDIDLKPDTKVKVAMKVGRLTLDPAVTEWLDARRKVKHKGIVLHMKDVESGGAGYAELDLSRPEDKKVYDTLMEWLEDGTDPRIRDLGIRVLSGDSVPAPLVWWDTAHWKSLLSDVSKGIRIMPDAEQRKRFVESCVRYEMQRDEPRQGLIDGLLAIELDGVSNSDPMAVPE